MSKPQAQGHGVRVVSIYESGRVVSADGRHVGSIGVLAIVPDPPTGVAIIKPGPHRAKRVRRAVDDPGVAAVVVEIDAPGGPSAHLPPSVRVEV